MRLNGIPHVATKNEAYGDGKKREREMFGAARIE